MSLLVGLPLGIFRGVFMLIMLLVRLALPILLIALVIFLLRRSRSGAASRQTGEEPPVKGPVVNVDYRVVEDDDTTSEENQSE